MLTFRGIPIRRLMYLWRNADHEPVYLVETTKPRMGYHVPLSRIETDQGIEEVLRTARTKRGKILTEDY